MHPVVLRRFALTAAAVSTGMLMLVLLVGSALPGQAVPVAEGEKAEKTARETPSAVFPADISCTEMRVAHLAEYSGTFYEDGSPREVFQTAAIVLENRGDTCIPYAQITVRTQWDTYVFEGFLLPPNSYTLIPERTAKPYPKEQVISVFGWNTRAYDEPCPSVTVTEQKKGTLLVKNMSGETVEGLTLYHKMYLPGDDLYIGGVAFATAVPTLAPQETVTAVPEYYAPGYSRILYVRKIPSPIDTA